MSVRKAAPRHLYRHLIRSIGNCVLVLAAWYLTASFQTTKDDAKNARQAPSASARPSVASLEPCIIERSHTQRIVNARARVSSKDAPSLRFVTFAFTRNAGDRWGVTTTRRALKLMYSSLVRAHTILPTLYVLTDSIDVIPSKMTMRTRVDIVPRVCDASSLPKNPYSTSSHRKRKNNEWASVSRAKLDVVEDLILQEGEPVIWIDLDTLVFTDLSIARQREASSWMVGYQRGNVNMGLKRYAEAHFRYVRPEFDALGDLWSLDLDTIAKVRDFEKRWMSRVMATPPKYDVQAYFSLMLESGVFSENVLLHNILPGLNFGFTCSSFQHPTSENMKVFVEKVGDARYIMCCVPKGVKMSPRVGTMSFTAKSFQRMFLSKETPTFTSFSDEDVRAWFIEWFYSPL